MANKYDFTLSDTMARESFKKSPNTVISFILTASYLYYFFNRSFLSDEVFDNMCKWAYDNYNSIEHPHKHLITKEDMRNGSAFHLKEKDYPTIVVMNAQTWLYKQEK